MPRATLYIVDEDNVWLRRRGAIEPVLEYTVDKHWCYWIKTPNDERGLPIWHIYSDGDLEIRDSRPPKDRPKDASISVAALIADLNHFSQYYFFDNTPEGQRFSYETHGQIGGRKLRHDRD